MYIQNLDYRSFFVRCAACKALYCFLCEVSSTSPIYSVCAARASTDFSTVTRSEVT